MEKLTPKETEIMQVLWKLEKAFVKEILAELPPPKPHYNTVSTIIRKLEEKGWVGHEKFGTTHRYFPQVKVELFRERYLGGILDHYFENSYKNLVSFFAKKEKISVEDLKEIIEDIEENNQ